MGFDIGFIKADTHTPEYLMHKYWARKPHNVINECISALTEKGDTVLDPFSGSGVVLREGGLLGRTCFGFDLNPVAVLISSVLLNPPSVDEFISTFNEIFKDAYKNFGYLYETADGQKIKYVSHRIISKCDCGLNLRQDQCLQSGKKFICPVCGTVVHFNSERLVDTEIFGISVENNKMYRPSETELNRQKEFSEKKFIDIDYNQFNFQFPLNRRILSYDGISTSSFFTKRNFAILSFFADRFWKIDNNRVRDCSLLLLTASAAQCSRLIASRNNLSTGGPAWSVPGFWVPPEHLETNPFVHFKVRLKKFTKAIEELNKKPLKAMSTIELGDSMEKLKTPLYKELKADLIFLDPPYGDSVPYTEFSNIWNSFLKNIPNSDKDLSVSDRIEKKESWCKYRVMLNSYIDCFKDHLKKSGKLLITFNNNDMRAWEALLFSLQNNNFVCKSVFYQIPAVISSKAQMSLNSSYISDIYSIYVFDGANTASQDLSPIISHLCFVANVRGGVAKKTVIDREFIISWMKNNIDYKMLSEKKKIINALFDIDKKTSSYILKTKYIKQTVSIKSMVVEKMKELCHGGTCSLLDSYIKINKSCYEYGIMELNEFKEYISDFAIEDDKIIGYSQLSLF